ncbi:hypothetical protein TNCV_1082901 [Trichonephila clavipes]|nr:hypothetical protein TNCV_1082901 [Trichonephila clavipes]
MVPSRETIRRRLTEVGLRQRPLRRLPLTPHHRQCRLDFFPTSGNSVTDWRRVIFSDESRFSLRADYHRTRVGGAPASGPIRHLLSSGIQQFHKRTSRALKSDLTTILPSKQLIIHQINRFKLYNSEQDGIHHG